MTPTSMPAAADGAVALTHWGVIRAQGADAASFLHGQLTQDIVHLGAGEARLAGYCSAKGRLLATFIVWRPADDEVLLACSADLLAPTLKRLSMFVLRAKCRLTDATADLPLFGVAGPHAAALAGGAAPWQLQRDPQGIAVIRLPDAAGAPRALVAGAAPEAPPLDPALWRWLEVESGIAMVQAATVDRFVPQMLNHEVVGAVNFQKGCYPGQEIVARAQYRGAVKRRTFLYDVDAPAAPGGELFHDDDPGQPCGTVADAAAAPGTGRTAVLAEVKLSAAAAGAIHLGAPDGPVLQARALPYALPALDDAA